MNDRFEQILKMLQDQAPDVYAQEVSYGITSGYAQLILSLCCAGIILYAMLWINRYVKTNKPNSSYGDDIILDSDHAVRLVLVMLGAIVLGCLICSLQQIVQATYFPKAYVLEQLLSKH